MVYTIRFRPVVFGETPGSGPIYPIYEQEDGRVTFRDMEWPWPVESSLEAVTVEDLPEFHRRWGVSITILPVREVTSATAQEAYRLMYREIQALQDREVGREAEVTGVTR